MSTQTLTITRGLPASAKSTWAKQQVARNPENIVRINRDDIRMMWFNGPFGTPSQEKTITSIQHSMIRAALDARRCVIVDDTNLRSQTVHALHKIAAEYEGRVQFRVQDFAVNVEECIRRDALRERSVGAEVIRNMSNRYMNGGDTLPLLPAALYQSLGRQNLPEYVEDPNLPHAWLVDIDGTIASMTEGGRGPYDYHLVDEDAPVERVISLVNILHKAGHPIVIMSGREDSCLEMTKAWLEVFEVPYDEIYMRATGDGRRDSIVKSELFEAHIRGRYYIDGVLDDRDQVVKMWREEKGLLVAQVAYGNF